MCFSLHFWVDCLSPVPLSSSIFTMMTLDWWVINYVCKSSHETLRWDLAGMFFSRSFTTWVWDTHGCGDWSKTCTGHWGVTACPAHWLTDWLLVCLFWLASGSPERSLSLKWLECFLSVFSVEGSAEKCGFSRPLWLYNMYQPFPAAAAEAGALKTDFMCGLCHPCRQMDGAP